MALWIANPAVVKSVHGGLLRTLIQSRSWTGIKSRKCMVFRCEIFTVAPPTNPPNDCKAAVL